MEILAFVYCGSIVNNRSKIALLHLTTVTQRAMIMMLIVALPEFLYYAL